MKKLFIIGTFLVGGIGLLNAQEIELSESNVDLGNVKFAGKAITTVQIKNTGDKPLIISDAKASCGCTVPTWPKDPIAPGKTADMTVEYKTTSKAGAFNKTVTISSNAVTEGRKIFRIKGVVEQDPNAPKVENKETKEVSKAPTKATLKN